MYEKKPKKSVLICHASKTIWTLNIPFFKHLMQNLTMTRRIAMCWRFIIHSGLIDQVTMAFDLVIQPDASGLTEYWILILFVNLCENENKILKCVFYLFFWRIILGDHLGISFIRRRKPSVSDDKHHRDALLQQLVESQNWNETGMWNKKI